ncbi:HsdM family class I SAM-dependent methyltransferase [Priestia megaterium]|uniref:HsdM family class I SAM-dependent methyltransferase n=1 Tax=Priestia megaterium TaxID=1404 RepID=UPI0012D9FE41|nr:N-6 DNA methylase [Priestia megaterium]MUL33941.1 putative type I restriction enzymeP M protein [Priestia megaterium]
MEQLKQKLNGLGYKEIIEVNESTFMAGRNGVYIFAKQVEEGTDLNPELIIQINYEAMEMNPFPNFAWITNSINNVYLNVEEEKSISEIPAFAEMDTVTVKRRELTEKDKWSNRMYSELQRRFNAIHEQIYASGDNVNNSNDAIDEFCKLIFMEEFRLNNRDYILREGNLAGRKYSEIFHYSYLDNAKDKKKVIEEIREAFREIKNHEDYVAVNDEGERIPIFSQDDYLKLQNPNIYETVMKALQDLGKVEDNGVEKTATLLDLTGDVLGRVFDVLLRGKYENKGGMGIYLTPRQVTEAAVEMVMHDLTNQGASKIIGKDPKTGIPTLRVLDPTCGSAGFLIKMLEEIKGYMLYELSGNKDHHQTQFKEMLNHCFVGADRSSGMVLKARLNMALHGALKASIFQTLNSLSTPSLKPESFDAIITNPPFKKGGVTVKDKDGKYLIKEVYSTDIDEEGTNRISSAGLSLGSKPDSKGKWKPVSSIDPAVLFIDRCLQLLKPGGFMMMVVPDGILSNSGDQYIREYIMGKKNSVTGEFEGGKGILKAVISLPQETFKLSGAGAKTSLLYVKKKEHVGEKQGPVFMAVADEVGFEVKNNAEVPLGDDRNDLLKIVEAYKKGMPEDKE